MEFSKWDVFIGSELIATFYSESSAEEYCDYLISLERDAHYSPDISSGE